jgi:hypothetical protein
MTYYKQIATVAGSLAMTDIEIAITCFTGTGGTV